MTNRTCSIPDCEKPHWARGWCSAHYQRWRRGIPIQGEPVRSRPEIIPDLVGKACTKCGEYKFHDEYTRVAKGSDKRQGTCKACVREGQRNNPQKYRRNVEWERRQKAAETEWAQARLDRQRHVRYRRRAAKRSNYVEFVSPTVVFERDGYICQLCEESISRDATYPDLMSPSIDHVIPLSRGGEHSYANTQTAHLRCNISKGNREALADQATTR